MTIRALYPLYPPIRLYSETHNEIYNKFVSYFREPRSILIRGSHFHDKEKLTVRVLQCTPPMQKKLFAHSQFRLRTKHVLEFIGSFRFPGIAKYQITDRTGKIVPETVSRLRRFWLDDLPGYLDVTIQTYLCALIIASSGAVHVTGNIWSVGKQEHRFSRTYVTPISWAVEYLRKNGVRSPDGVDYKSTINWVFGQSGMFNGYSNTPAARALNYFTRLFVPAFRNDELSNTVWALAGIEALLVEGGRSSGGQLREKLNALFGTAENSSWLTEMTDLLYQYRSKMVHGNRQIKSALQSDDVEESAKRFDEELYSEQFAIGILTLLLQHIIVREQSSFRFKTVLDKSSP